ncbi:hypothetical protein [Klebsiella aerogenes]|uniref:hypothetical protein n=1 Tax=Klebsiella aerogenes TaxID=548 RepID=UPI00351CBB4D
MNTLTSRQQKYCSRLCKQLDSRKLGDWKVGYSAHSYWNSTEHNLQRNPLGLGSINGPDDVIAQCKLHERKAEHQRSYTSDDNPGSRKLVPFLKLEICHRYPNSKGGANTQDNLLIGPKFINRLLRDAIPCQDYGMGGYQSKDEPFPVTSLYSSLEAYYGVDEAEDMIERMGPPKIFHGTSDRPLVFQGIQRELPLFKLFVQEVFRLGYRDLCFAVNAAERATHKRWSIYLELGAILGFYAFLTGDGDRFLARLLRLQRWFNEPEGVRPHRFRGHLRSDYERHMHGLLKNYLMRFFVVDIEDPHAVADFYNNFYSKPVVAVAWGVGLTCYNYGGFIGWRDQITEFIASDPTFIPAFFEKLDFAL